MSALDISEIVVSQMQRLTFVFAPPTISYANINVVATDGDGVILIDEPLVDVLELEVDTAIVMIGRTESAFALGNTYHIHLETETESGATIEHEVKFILIDNVGNVIDVPRSNETTIQQAIYDVISADPIYDSYGRVVTVVHNGVFIAEDITDGEDNSVMCPFLAIGRPVITQTEVIGLNAYSVLLELQIRIKDTQDDSQSNNVTHLHGIARTIVNRLIVSSDLGLHNMGLMDNCMEFKIENPTDIDDDDPLNTLILNVEITQIQTT